MTFTHALATNNYGPAKFIVDASAANGTHTTIASALTAASSGDSICIRPGTYTENLTLKAGVNIYGATGEAPQYSNVNIVGKLTGTYSGNVAISGINFTTNSDFILSFTSGSPSLYMTNCTLNATNATAINMAAGGILLELCDTINTGAQILHNITGGAITYRYCNLGGAATAATASAGLLSMVYCSMTGRITTSGTAAVDINYSVLLGTNNTAFTHGASGVANLRWSKFDGGTASAISISGGSTVVAQNIIIKTSNATAVAGAGNLTYNEISFADSGVTLAPTIGSLQVDIATLVLQNPLGLTSGGTNASLTASNGGIFYSTATAGAILAGTATAGQIIRSGASTTPSWSTATYPATAGSSGNVLTSDGTNWTSAAPATGGTVVAQVFTGNGTYTPTAGMKYCVVEVVGGGGGGGATTSTSGSTVSAGGGGGGGGYAMEVISAATIGASQSVTVGAAGAAGAVAGGTGGTGGTTSVGALISATGGVGGIGSGAAAVVVSAGGAGGAGSGGSVNTTGGAGGMGFACITTQQFSVSGHGGNSFYGGGAAAVGQAAAGVAQVIGTTGFAYGGGGSGSVCATSGTQQAGGAGFAGVVVITEFI